MSTGFSVWVGVRVLLCFTREISFQQLNDRFLASVLREEEVPVAKYL